MRACMRRRPGCSRGRLPFGRRCHAYGRSLSLSLVADPVPRVPQEKRWAPAGWRQIRGGSAAEIRLPLPATRTHGHSDRGRRSAAASRGTSNATGSPLRPRRAGRSGVPPGSGVDGRPKGDVESTVDGGLRRRAVVRSRPFVDRAKADLKQGVEVVGVGVVDGVLLVLVDQHGAPRRGRETAGGGRDGDLESCGMGRHGERGRRGLPVRPPLRGESWAPPHRAPTGRGANP